MVTQLYNLSPLIPFIIVLIPPALNLCLFSMQRSMNLSAQMYFAWRYTI